jgi:hypothetical protein
VSKPDGGDAFPNNRAGNGMTLRDYFAAKALQGYLSQETAELDHRETIASVMYEWADAMLEARLK